MLPDIHSLACGRAMHMVETLQGQGKGKGQGATLHLSTLVHGSLVQTEVIPNILQLVHLSGKYRLALEAIDVTFFATRNRIIRHTITNIKRGNNATKKMRQ